MLWNVQSMLQKYRMSKFDSHVGTDEWEIEHIVQKLEVKSDIIERAFFNNSQGSLQLAIINLL